MGKLTHAAGRKVFSGLADYILNQVDKNREEAYMKFLDTAEKYMDDTKIDANWEYLKEMISSPEYTLNKYVNSIVDEIDPHVLKTTIVNLGYEAMFHGTKKIREMREVHKCNIPWIILMDPTSACNLHCTGCWAAEYGNKLNLSLDEMDFVIRQGKELGVYFYMLTGGEPLVRKKDVIELCRKHNDCVILAYTNGTLVDEELCKQMQEVGNLYLAISLEEKPEVNDLRRGEGVYGKVMHAMELLKAHGLVFGTSICYTSQNIESVTSDEFIQMIIEKGCRYSFYFHYMPVGNDAAVDLLPSSEQRTYMYHRVREIRNMKKRPEILKQPLCMVYHNNQPFNENHLRPCPMLENPKILQRLVRESGAHSTDLQSPESAEHLCGKCKEYAANWAETAEELWKKGD